MQVTIHLSNTKLYLHGDGANWISSSLNYLPNAVFVLAPYHKNKYLRQSVRDMGDKSAKKYREPLFSALRDGDKERFAALSAEILKANGKKAEEAPKYLSKHFDAIHIRYTNPEARNGGATEAHISRVLSSHLSSRPMAWSEKTLKHLVPVLAVGQFFLKKETPDDSPSLKKAKVKKTKSRSFFSRPARPGQGGLASRTFLQSHLSFQCPPPFLTPKSYNNLTPTGLTGLLTFSLSCDII